MDDSFERHLRSLLQEEISPQSAPDDDKRLERVLHRAHIHGGLFDLLTLFANWGWVIGEGGARGLRHAKPIRREKKNPSSSDLNS